MEKRAAVVCWVWDDAVIVDIQDHGCVEVRHPSVLAARNDAIVHCVDVQKDCLVWPEPLNVVLPIKDLPFFTVVL